MRSRAPNSMGRFYTPIYQSGWDPSSVTLQFSGQATETIVLPRAGGSRGMKRNTGSWRPQSAWVGNVINNPYF